MRTAFGKYLSKMRVDRDMLLKEMAELLEVSPAYVSAVETGKKPVSEKLISKICKIFELDELQCQELRMRAEESKNEVTVKYDSSDKRGKELAIAFARRFNSLSDDKKQSLLKELEEAKM
jgi:transcriptional regulator with XRE-family HTH domain